MRSLHVLSLALLGLPVISAQQVSNFNITRAVASKNGCGEQCFEFLQVTDEADLSLFQAKAGFDSDFYATASNFSGSSPGDLLKLEPVDPDLLDVVDGTTIYRIQYTSIDLDGSYVPATGFIALPLTILDGRTTYPLVAFAHGTSGVYQGCAPSTGPGLFDYHTWSPLVDNGYAVVATDYAGLGNNATLHKYSSYAVHATDIYYSVIAARQAFGSLFSKEWLGIGHSQGGGAIWKLAESRFVKDKTSTAGRYLGTVAISPGTRIIDMFVKFAEDVKVHPERRKDIVAAELPSVAIGMQRAIPGYNLSILGDVLLKRTNLMEIGQLCTNAMMGMTLDLSMAELYNKEGANDKRVKEWQRTQEPAAGDRSMQPVLVIQGLNDTGVLPYATEEAWERSCKSGNSVQLRLYDGFDHSPTVAASAPEWLAWIRNRFAKQTLPRGCEKKTRVAINKKFVKAPAEFDLSGIVWRA